MKAIKSICIFILLFCQLSSVFAKGHFFYEKDYQNYWCGENNGVTEYILPDKTRVDCLTDSYAIEFDFANKWAEAIGQSLYYANSTNKKAGIVLILEYPEKEQRYLNRVKRMAKLYNIKLWTISPEDMENAS